MIRTAKRQRFDKSALLSFVKKNFRSILFFSLFFIGMIIGAILVKSASGQTLESLGSMTNAFVDKRLEQSFSSTLLSSFGSSALYLLLLFVLGFCAIAPPFIAIIPLFKGLGLGFSIGYFYAYFGLQGLFFVFLTILPAALISTFVIVAACNQAYGLSLIFLGGIRSEKSKPSHTDTQSSITVKKYVMRFIFFLVVILVSSSFEAICSLLFGQFFSFS